MMIFFPVRRTLMLSPGQQDTGRLAAATANSQSEIEIAVSDQEKISQVATFLLKIQSIQF